MENLNKVAALLDLYCLASGALINWEKSKAISASAKPRDIDWGQHIGL